MEKKRKVRGKEVGMREGWGDWGRRKRKDKGDGERRIRVE